MNVSNLQQAVILESDFESGLELGSETELMQVQKLEELIAKSLGSKGEVDGHDLGEGMFTIYVYGESADSLFDSIKDVLLRSPFARFEITLQYGSPDDSRTQEKKFTLN